MTENTKKLKASTHRKLVFYQSLIKYPPESLVSWLMFLHVTEVFNITLSVIFFQRND